MYNPPAPTIIDGINGMFDLREEYLLNENFCATCVPKRRADPDKKELLSWGPSHCGRSSISYKRYPNYRITVVTDMDGRLGWCDHRESFLGLAIWSPPVIVSPDKRPPFHDFHKISNPTVIAKKKKVRKFSLPVSFALGHQTKSFPHHHDCQTLLSRMLFLI